MAALVFVGTLVILLGLSAAGVADVRDAPSIALATALLAGWVHYVGNRTGAATRRRLERTEERLARFEAKMNRRLSDIEGHVRLGFVDPPYPLPFESWSMAPDAAVLLAERIGWSAPAFVLELGSGMTTVLIGLVLRRAGGGRLLALEHDAAWANRTRRHVAAMHLQDRVDVVDAPLKTYELAGRACQWYSLPADLDDRSIDFVLVDGPPQYVDPDGSPRYPALPLLHGRLSSSAVVFVDDADRPGEEAMLRRWAEEFPEWQSERTATVKGSVVLTRRSMG